MSMLEMAILFGFGIPLVLLCGAFVVLAGMLQMAEDEVRVGSEA